MTKHPNARAPRPTLPSLAVLLILLVIPGFAYGEERVPNAVDALKPHPLRLGMDIFGKTAEIEVRDLPQGPARLAIEEALHEIYYVSLYLDPDGAVAGGLGELNREAGKKEVTLDRRTFELLIRGLQFCLWSSGVYSPGGGAVYRLWRQQASPYPADLQAAAASAGCRQIRLAGGEAGKPGRATLATGTRVEALGLAEGFAIDRAMDVLTRHGARNAFVSLGPVRRAMGVGPEGRGWLVDVPALVPGQEPIDQVWLLDQSFAVSRIDDNFRPVDLRSGIPGRGNQQVAAVTLLAADAQGLTTTLFVMSQTQGQQHLGALQPKPAVFWLSGQQGGVPVESSYRWTTLSRPNSMK